MLKQIAVGKALQELQDKIRTAYGLSYRVRVTGVIAEIEGPDYPKHEVVLRPTHKKQPSDRPKAGPEQR
jgi:hypothetical protein